MRLSKPKILKPELVFLFILIGIGLIYNYQEVAFQRPVGIHLWRNCVSASFPVNYYYGGNFFTPQTNALLADNNSSDVTVVEFPLIYYIISVFYRIFGVNVFWYKMVQVCIGFLGLLYLFKASYFFTRNWFYAGVIPLIIFTSPIYAFYLNNFIPDAAALSLTFAGFYFFMKYASEKRFRPWLTAMGFFLLAGLTKTSSLLPFFGLGGAAFLDLVPGNKRGGADSYFKYNFKYIGSYLMVLVLIFAWYTYARIYSDAHGGSVSPVEIRPLWKLDKETIRMTLEGMKGWFRPGYYHERHFLILSLLVFAGTLVWIKKANRFLAILNVMVFLGAGLFTVLFFFDMKNHDYYQINNLFLLVTTYLTFFSILDKVLPRIYNSLWTRLVFTALIIFLLIKCNDRMHFRYSERDYYYVSTIKTIEMYDIENYLDEIGVDRSAKVYCSPDRSINISLYLCNRKGITDYSTYRTLPLEERLIAFKKLGIEYLILGSREPYKEVENLDQVLGEKIGQTGDTEIYRIK